MNIDKIKEKLLPIKGNRRSKFFRELKSYVYVYCEITDENKRLPIYIGKGKSARFFSHLNNLENDSNRKNKKIIELIKEKKLGIDILAYGLDDKTALSVESACIDLMGIHNLANIVRGHGDNIKRVSLKELTSLITKQTVKVKKEHRGVSILINRDYKPTFGDIELFEITRGIWSKKMVTISRDALYAYATFKGVVKASSPATTWSSGGETNTDRAYGHCFGPQTAAQMAAGEAPPRVTVSEQYDGTSWTEVNDTNHAGGVQARAGSGTQTAATIAAFAGASVPYGHAETWNGTSWSDTSELNTTKYSRASTLTSGPAALVFGGTAPPDGATANTESFDGTSWTEVNNLNAANYTASGVGSPTAGMNINGYVGSGYTTNVESWNGTSWSEGTNTNAAQGYGGAAGASSSNAVKFGGSGGPTGYSAITELWNGSSWTEIGNLSTSYAGNIGTGSSAAALNIPGKSAPSTYPGACEEFTGDITLQTITVS